MEPEPQALQISPDKFVALSYVLFDQDGNIAAQADREDPLTYVHGYAQIVPGLERGVAGMAKGERREIVVDPDEAFGEPDEKAVFEIDRADLPDLGRALQVGDELVAEDDEDDQLLMRVVELKKETVLVDTNHPLAGQTVRFVVEVCDVRAATDDEIAEAEADLESRADVLCCGDLEHTHEHDGASGRDERALRPKPHEHEHAHDHHHQHDLVPLRRKLPN